MKINLSKSSKYLACAALSLAVISCTGGSSSGGDNPSPTPQPTPGPTPTPTAPVAVFDPSNGGVSTETPSSVNPMIVLKFKEPIQPLTVNKTTISLVKIGQKNVVSSKNLQNTTVTVSDITSSADNTRFTLHPVAPLDDNSEYQIQVNQGVMTLSGAEVQPFNLTFATGDTKAPNVAMLEPSNGESNVLLSPTIRFQFSEKVLNVSPTTVTLHKDTPTGELVNKITNLTAGYDNTYNVVLNGSLNENSKYYVVFNEQIKDEAGNTLTPINFNFVTGDFTKPTVSMTTPSNNATGIQLNPSITLQFNEKVQGVVKGNVTLHQGSKDGTNVDISEIKVGDNNTYTFNVKAPLNNITPYYVVLNSNIKDMANNALDETDFHFTTGEFDKPIVQMTTPSNNATDVSLTPVISLHFNEEVQGVNKENVALHEGSKSGTQIDINEIQIGDNNTYTFSPSKPLDLNTTYYVALTNDIKDNNNNSLENISFQFTTVKSLVIGNAGFSAGPATYQNLAIAPNGTPYVAYKDGTNDKTTVMKFDGDNWVNVGQVGFSAGVATYQSLAIAPDGTPYVAYEDSGNNTKTTVMKFDGTNWVNVGKAGFSADVAMYQSLAIAPDGTPYVAYRDGNFGANLGGRATVMKFDGTNWVNVGKAGFSTGIIAYASLAIAPNGTPYVAYKDGSNDKTTVMKFDGTNWINVGQSGFSAGINQSLAIAPDSTPYVSYTTSKNSSVMKFDGTNWVNIGSPDVGLNYQSLVIAPNGTPYATANTTNGTVMIMKFDGTNWVQLNNAAFTSSYADWRSLAIAPNGTPYVAYQDNGNNTKITVRSF